MARPFLTGIDLGKNELQNARVQNLATAPSSPVTGQLYYDTDDNILYWWNGGSWVSAQGGAGGIPGTIGDAKGDLVTFSAADTPVRKAAGANGTFLQAQSGQSDGLLWTALADGDIPAAIARDSEVVLQTLADAKGDLVVASGADVWAKQTVGANGTLLVAASGQANGVEWRVLADADIPATIARDSEVTAAVDAHVNDTADAHDASAISFSPVGNLSATDVQAALAELETDFRGEIEGRRWKDPVDAATTGVLPDSPTYNAGAGTLTAGANAAFPTTDGVAPAVGLYYLVKDQASSFQNGIYTLTTLGSGAAAWVLTRRADSSTAAELLNVSVMVDGGDDHDGDIFTQTAVIDDLTADTQTWAKTGDTNTVYTADGTTIELVGNSFRIATGAAGNGLSGGGGSALAVSVDGTTIEISSDAVRIAASAAGDGLTGGGGSALAVGAGTGISVTANAVAIDPAVVTRKVSADCAAALTTTVNHALNTRDVEVQVYRNSSPWENVEVDVERTDANNVLVRFSVAPAAADYRIVIQG
jgi:hypothetical protein